MLTLNVDLAERSYPIIIGQNLISPDNLLPFIKHRQVMIVTNETVAPLYLESVETALPGKDVAVTTLPDGERFKNLDSINEIFNQLLAKRHNRSTTLIALGGGVIGDMTGFAAATYQRGVDFVQIPTTLLSQVDSSVGGKTGVNHSMGKNMIGAFYQPKSVIIDIDTLQTLNGSELSAGMAEVIKYGLIRDSKFLKWLEDHLEEVFDLNAEVMEKAIYRSCELKSLVVAEDETEQGIRAILNLGHTFGHAIEAFTQYKSWLHGEAVAAGMMMATDLSVRLGALTKSDLKRVEDILVRAKLPTRPPKEMTANDFLRFMAVDKKVIDGKLRLILMKSIGEAYVEENVQSDLLKATLNQFTH